MDKKTTSKNIHMMIFFCTFALGVAILLTMQVLSGTSPALDIWARELRNGWDSPSQHSFFQNVTVLGSSEFLAPFTLIMSAWLWWRKKDLLASVILFVGVAVTYALNKGVKFAIQRERPGWSGAIPADGFSYPSGGAMLSMLCFALVAYFCMRHTQSKWVKFILFVITATVILLTGLSRFVLGAHFLTDVIAGFSLGFISLFVLIGFYYRFSQNDTSSD